MPRRRRQYIEHESIYAPQIVVTPQTSEDRGTAEIMQNLMNYLQRTGFPQYVPEGGWADVKLSAKCVKKQNDKLEFILELNFKIDGNH